MSACGCFRQTAHILIVRKLISRIIEHQKTRTQNSSRRCANTSRYKYLKHKAPGMPLSTGYMIKIKQFMPVSDMYMLIYLKYARAYALLKKAFCYAQKGQICFKICGHYGPKPRPYHNTTTGPTLVSLANSLSGTYVIHISPHRCCARHGNIIRLSTARSTRDCIQQQQCTSKPPLEDCAAW